MTNDSLCIRDLGRMAYAPALEVQRQVHQQVRDDLEIGRASWRERV